MACSYSSTVPRPGDSVVVLLRKWLQSVGAGFDCPDEREYNLVWELVEHYGGTPRPGDTLPELWQKVLRALGDNTCHCGDWQWNAIKRILDILSPGSFSPGDSISDLLRKILEAVNVTPVPPLGPDLSQLIFFSRMTVAPTDNTTYFLGFTDSFINSYDAVKIPIPVSGTLRRLSVKVQFVLGPGSGELVNHFLRVNDSVDVGSLSFAWNASNVSGFDLDVNHPVVAGDLIALKIVTPAWATNPTSNIRIYGSVVIEPV
jgi:hypothetical protein